MKRSHLLVSAACLALGVLAWGLVQKLRGPVFAGYDVQSRPLVQTVVATGRVAAVSRAQVGSPVTGVVVERRVQEGDAVQPGDVLAVLRADDLEAAVREAEAAMAQLQQSTRPQAQAALREAEARLTQASREVARRRELFQRQLVARETLEQAIQAETVARTAAEQARLAVRSLASGNPDDAAARARLASAKAQLAKTTVRAEVAGTVLTRNVEPGDLVQPGRILFEIARTGATEVLVPLDEKNLEVLAIGQSAVCIADAYPSRPFPAKVTFIAPSVDPQRGSVDIRLTVAPVPDFVRQDMTVSVNVETGSPRTRRRRSQRRTWRRGGRSRGAVAGRRRPRHAAQGPAGHARPDAHRDHRGHPGGRPGPGRRDGSGGRRRPGARVAVGDVRDGRRVRHAQRTAGSARLTPMWIEWTIATRFLREGKAQSTLILVGIAVGVAVIVFLTALITGLQGNIIDRTLGTQAHIKVQPPDEINRVLAPADGSVQLVLESRRAQRLRSINNWQQVRDVLDALPRVTAVSPVISGPAFARRGDALESVALVGIDARALPAHHPDPDDIVAGVFRIGAGDAVIGRQLAIELGMRVGDKLRIDGGQGRESVLNVAGIFELGVRELDARYVYLDMKQAQSLLDLPGAATIIDVTVDEIFAAQAVAARIARLTGLKAESWMETNAQLMNALRSQSLSTQMISVFVALSVALGIASVLSVSVVQRTARDRHPPRHGHPAPADAAACSWYRARCSAWPVRCWVARRAMRWCSRSTPSGPKLFYIPVESVAAGRRHGTRHAHRDGLGGASRRVVPLRLDPVEAIRHV